MADRPGLHVAFLGIDGCGKSTLVRELAERARALGVPVRTVSWRAVIEQPDPAQPDPAQPDPDPPYPVAELRRLWARSFRFYFAGATGPDGTPLDLPLSYADLNARGGTEYLNGQVLRDQPPEGPLASAWIELAANTLLHHEVIRPLVAQGHLVLQESYGYKHLLKLFSYAENLAGSSREALRHCRDFARAYFAGHLAPDVGVFVSVAPPVALRWRLGQSGALGTFETYASAGADPNESFLRMQAESAASFADFAERFGWATIPLRDVPRPANWPSIREALRSTPLADRLRLDEPSRDEPELVV